jgi:membrane protein DedA with SNARE-associated domain
VTSLVLDYGLVLLAVLVAVESAGVPVPGETALVTAAVLARPEHDRYSLVWVIVAAAVGAIIGDNVGYALGRFGGRRLLDRTRLTRRYAERTLPPAERFFERHGAKTVFLGRFVALLRVTSAWLAGISRMHWWRFFVWNALGGIVWAVGVALLAYWAGEAVVNAVTRWGFFGLAVALVLGVIAFFVIRALRRRVIGEVEET